MKWSELIRLAQRNGWSLYRHGKRHDIYRKAGRIDEMQVGRHDSEEIKPGLLKKLLKQIEE
jgi:predicted RNA binding protein YcfA (HicA-like mRNA interferase family)